MHQGVKRFLEETAPQFPATRIIFQLRLLEEQLLNRGGTAPNQAPLAEPLPLPCLLPFDEIVVTADGRVYLCCQDHAFEEVMGNVNHQSLEQIWWGERFQALRQQLAQGDRTGSKFCQGCDFRGYKEEHLTPVRSLRNRLVGYFWNRES